jgi:ADP-sugar diphosphatase
MISTRIKNIPVSFVENLENKQIEAVSKSYKLLNYINRNLANKNVEIRSIRIDKVSFFGNQVGFIYLESEIFVDGRPVPGIAFLRGDSVAIMPVISVRNKEDDVELYSIVVEQYRANIGRQSIGLPAGMIDNDGQIFSTALKEMEEEVGDLGIDESNINLLMEYYPSSGGCDEKMSILSVDIKMDYDTLMSYQNKITGAKDENEFIKTHVIKFIDLPNYGTKAKLAFNEYQ